jgi:hypothetical protein
MPLNGSKFSKAARVPSACFARLIEMPDAKRLLAQNGGCRSCKSHPYTFLTFAQKPLGFLIRNSAHLIAIHIFIK